MEITPSHLIQYLYCPRFTYFEFVLSIPQNEEKYYKVMKGRELHQKMTEQNKNYLRKRIGVKQKWIDQYLSNGKLRGIVDEVLQLNNNLCAPLDYKFAKWEGKVYRTYNIQLACYAILIEQNFHCKVTHGYLVYTRSSNHLETVEINDDLKKEIETKTDEILNVIENNYFPKATKFKNQCLNCTYRNICIK